MRKNMNTIPSFWLGLQMDYDLDVAKDLLSLRIKNKVKTPGYCIALPNRAKKIFFPSPQHTACAKLILH